jgi:flagellin-like hook-associated protein FlgL
LFTGTTPSASTINANNTVTVRYTGASALIDSKGVAYNATVQYQYQLNSKTGGRPAWVATVTDISDPATNQTIAGFTSTDIPHDGNTTNVGFNPSDTLRGPLNMGPVSFATPNGTLKFTLPVNSATFSTSGATALVPGGEAPTSLSANITDTSYFQTPNPPSADTTNSQLTARVSDELTLNYGIRADNLAFENLVRVLNFMQSQSTPPSQADLQSAQTLISNSINGVQTLRAQVAGNQITLNDEKKYHQTVVNLATDTRSSILSADTTEVGVKITDLRTILEASYSTLSTIRGLSLVNFLK